MPYVFVRENAIKYWCVVQGLSHNEMRVLAEKVQDQPEVHDDKQKRAEFSLPTWLILNALEVMGFKVRMVILFGAKINSCNKFLQINFEFYTRIHF